MQIRRTSVPARREPGADRAGLGRTGAALLRILSGRLGEVVPTEELCAALWPGRAGQERALSVAVHRLRAKLERDPQHPVHLRTVRGEGYVLERPEPPPEPAPVAPAPGFRLSDGTLDPVAGVVRRGGQAVELGTAELALVRALIAAGQPVPREALKTRTLGYRAATRTRAVDAALARLRRKLERDPAAPVHLVTVRGRGIALVPAAEPAARPFAWERPLVGRAAEIAAVLRRLAGGARLITVTGPPGVGKSRVAAAAAERAFGPAAVPVDVRRAGLGPAVAAALGVGATGIGEALAARGRTALVLDDADELGPDDGDAVRRWLERAPAATILVAARRRTGLAGEVLVELAPLSPDEAMALYEARAADLGVRLVGEPHRRAVAAALAAHDHLPLAIELLAAAADGAPPAPGEGEALDAALGRSWAALSPAERRALAQLTVFAAPVGAAAAAQVLDEPDRVPALRRASLLRAVPAADGAVRHDLLRTVHRYARAHGDPEAIAAAAERHTAWAIGEARAALLAATVSGPPLPDPDASAELLAVLARDPAPAVRAWTVVGLRHWLRHHDLGTLAREITALSAVAAALDPDLRALVGLLELYVREGSAAAGRDVDPAPFEALAAAAADVRIADGLRFVLGRVLANAGRAAEAHRLATSLTASPVVRHRGHGELLLGQLAIHRSDHGAVRHHLERAAARLRGSGSPEEVATALDALSVALREAGRLDDAEAALDEALWRVGSGPVADAARVKRGLIALVRLEPERARQDFALVLASAARRGAGGVDRVDALLGDALAGLELGDRLALDARLAEVEAGPVPLGYDVEIAVARALAAVDAGDADGESALAAMTHGTPMGAASIALALAWAHLAAGEPGGARQAASRGLQALESTGATLLAAQLAATGAIACARAGDDAAGEALLPSRLRAGPDVAAALQRLARAELAAARGERGRGVGDLVGLAPRSIALRLVLAPSRR